MLKGLIFNKYYIIKYVKKIEMNINVILEFGKIVML